MGTENARKLQQQGLAALEGALHVHVRFVPQRRQTSMLRQHAGNWGSCCVRPYRLLARVQPFVWSWVSGGMRTPWKGHATAGRMTIAGPVRLHQLAVLSAKKHRLVGAYTQTMQPASLCRTGKTSQPSGPSCTETCAMQPCAALGRTCQRSHQPRGGQKRRLGVGEEVGPACWPSLGKRPKRPRSSQLSHGNRTRLRGGADPAWWLCLVPGRLQTSPPGPVAAFCISALEASVLQV